MSEESLDPRVMNRPIESEESESYPLSAPLTSPAEETALNAGDPKVPEETWAHIVRVRPSPHLPPTPAGFRRTLMMAHPGKKYLEIGTRRGHSLAARLLHAGGTAVSVDLYIPNYAGEPNSGPSSVRQFFVELGRPDLRGSIAFLTGNSHDLLPLLPADSFAMILVDGDHTSDGAAQDLRDAKRLLAPGGILLFDDTDDPALLAVFRAAFPKRDKRWVTIEYPAADGASAWCRADRHA